MCARGRVGKWTSEFDQSGDAFSVPIPNRHEQRRHAGVVFDRQALAKRRSFGQLLKNLRCVLKSVTFRKTDHEISLVEDEHSPKRPGSEQHFVLEHLSAQDPLLNPTESSRYCDRLFCKRYATETFLLDLSAYAVIWIKEKTIRFLPQDSSNIPRATG